MSIARWWAPCPVWVIRAAQNNWWRLCWYHYSNNLQHPHLVLLLPHHTCHGWTCSSRSKKGPDQTRVFWETQGKGYPGLQITVQETSQQLWRSSDHCNQILQCLPSGNRIGAGLELQCHPSGSSWQKVNSHFRFGEFTAESHWSWPCHQLYMQNG